jgi:hypothetical protein
MISRREFFAASAAGTLLPRRLLGAGTERKKIAAISTAYHVRSHSDNFITRFLEGYWINDQYYPPPCDVVSLYTDQVHSNDISRRLAAAYGFQIYPTIADTLTLGAGKLAVDAVLLIGEHGDYPLNEKLQKLYPRYEFFRQIIDVFDKSGRAVPVFSDKHLSYDWNKAKWMWDQTKRLHFPMMAGSSVSVTFRRPELDFPLDSPFEEALVVASGWVEDGGIFHNLESLQCFVERRKGGETGVRAVQHLEGEAVWKAAAEGLWPRKLLEPALSRAQKSGKGRPEDVKNAVLCMLEYNDGFRGFALMLPGLVNETLFAARVGGEVSSTLLYVPIENSNNFSPLVDSIARMFIKGTHDYPFERTVLTTGALSFLMESRYQGHRRIETPALKIAYRAPVRSYYAHGEGS